MKTRVAVVVGLLAMLPGPVVGQYVNPSTVSPSFHALWVRRSMFQGTVRLAVIEITAAPLGEVAQPMRRLPIRVMALVSEPPEADFQPQPATLVYHAHVVPGEPPPARQAYYLVILYRQSTREGDWHLMPGMLPEDGRSGWSGGLVVESPDGEMVRAIRELIFAQTLPDARHGGSTDGDLHDLFEITMYYMGSADYRVRDFAASFAAINGMGLGPGQAHAEQRRRYARLVLNTADRGLRRRLSYAYANAQTDILPDQPELLAELFAQDDVQTAQQILGEALRQAAWRHGDLAPLLRRYLRDPQEHSFRPDHILQSLQHWQEGALALRPELEALALGPVPATPAQRVAALALLLDNDVPNAKELVYRTLVTAPSAVGLEYAARHRLNDAVPLLIGAVRAGRLEWSEEHAATVALLTGRVDDLASWPEVDRWWAHAQSAGLTEALVAEDFVSPRSVLQAQHLLVELSAPTFRRRHEAREALAELVPALPPSVREAVHDPDPEVARSAAGVVAATEERLDVYRRRLVQQAQAERRGHGDLTVRLRPVGAAEQ